MPLPLCTRRLGLALTLLAGASFLTGCIRSRVHITSEPSGAEVIWRGKPYGATPVTIPYVWYWHYDVTVQKPGYEPVHAMERFRTPPWFVMPLDLFMEILPIPIPDNRYRHYELDAIEHTQTALLTTPSPAADATSTSTTTSVELP